MFQCSFSTFAPERIAPSGRASAASAVASIAVACALLTAAALPPAGISAFFEGAAARIWIALIWWASIVLESMPFVMSGAIAATIARRIPNCRGVGPALAAMFAPGCDCSLAGFAPSLRTAPPGVAGFALAWGAAASPAALVATHAALGDRLVGARLAGAFVAATLTAALWSVWPLARPAHPCHSPDAPIAFADRARAAFAGLAFTALCATALLAASSDVWGTLSTPLRAAVFGSLLSPCSTADAVLARVLVHDPAGQAAFLVAAQCTDVRQLVTLYRSFGIRRMLLAAVAGCAGCIAAALMAK